ncbi:MAG: MerR family transcriptional regulator [Pseudomonadota bacterium]
MPVSKSADAFRTISEVAQDLELPQHVLRFWETRFNQIKPMKRGGGRRYYRPEDVELLRGIRYLLYSEGYTIKGVQRILKEHGNKFVASVGDGSVNLASIAAADQAPEQQAVTVSDVIADRAPPTRSKSNTSPSTQARLKDVLSELLECKRLLDQVRG